MDIKKVLHYYLGTPCVNAWYYPTSKDYDKNWKLASVSIENDIHFIISNDNYNTSTRQIKLKLRPLSDITTDECTQLCKLRMPQQNCNTIEITSKDDDCISYRDGTSWVCGDVMQYHEFSIWWNQLNSEQFHYLISQHFDLFGLIESGQAIIYEQKQEHNI